MKKHLLALTLTAVFACQTAAAARYTKGIDAVKAFVTPQGAEVVSAYDVGLKEFIVVKVKNTEQGAVSTLLVSHDGKLMTNELFDLSSGQPKSYFRQLEEVLSGPEIAAFVQNFAADKTITYTKGDGSRVLTVLADPNCSFCKKLEKEVLAKMDNITLHVLMFPFLREDSFTMANQIWCADNPQQAWHEWMVNGVTPPALKDQSCRYDTEYVTAATKAMGISGVPVIIVNGNNQIVRSGVSVEALEAIMAMPKGTTRLKGIKELKI